MIFRTKLLIPQDGSGTVTWRMATCDTYCTHQSQAYFAAPLARDERFVTWLRLSAATILLSDQQISLRWQLSLAIGSPLTIGGSFPQPAVRFTHGQAFRCLRSSLPLLRRAAESRQ